MRKALLALLCCSIVPTAFADCRPSRDARGSVNAQIICDPEDYATMPVPDNSNYYADDEDDVISDEERKNIIRRLYRSNRGGGDISSAVKGATTAKPSSSRRITVRN